MRRSLFMAAAAAVILSSASLTAAPAYASDPGSYAAALADTGRTAEDRARDEARHAAETLDFAGVRPGQKIADMIIGGGYFTRIFSAAVGPEGHVTAWQPAEFIAFQASYGDSLTAADALPNVDAIRSPIGAPEFPADLDLVFTAQNYHDLHLQPFPADTASKVNAAAFAALKPGGVTSSLTITPPPARISRRRTPCTGSTSRRSSARSRPRASFWTARATSWPIRQTRAPPTSSMGRSGGAPASSCCASASRAEQKPPGAAGDRAGDGLTLPKIIRETTP